MAATPDTGWRKAAVAIATVGALTVLAALGRLTPEVALAVAGPAIAYLGYNVLERRAR